MVTFLLLLTNLLHSWLSGILSLPIALFPQHFNLHWGVILVTFVPPLFSASACPINWQTLLCFIAPQTESSQLISFNSSHLLMMTASWAGHWLAPQTGCPQIRSHPLTSHLLLWTWGHVALKSYFWGAMGTRQIPSLLLILFLLSSFKSPISYLVLPPAISFTRLFSSWPILVRLSSSPPLCLHQNIWTLMEN